MSTEAPQLLDELLQTHTDHTLLEIETGELRPKSEVALVRISAEGSAK